MYTFILVCLIIIIVIIFIEAIVHNNIIERY